MGLFEALFNHKNHIEEATSYTPATIQEAYMAIFYSILYSDGKWSEQELKALNPIFMRLRIFEDENVSYYLKKVEEAYTYHGAKSLINGALQLISQKYRPQLYCLCAELVLADGVLHHREEQILEHLAKAAHVPEEVARKIIEVTMIRMMN